MLVHARINGSSHEITDLDLPANASDAEVRTRVANKLDIAVSVIDRHVVDRGPDGNIVVRPEAVYG